MTIELNLRFPEKDRVIVSFDDEESGQQPFLNPIVENDLREIQWYVEVYAAHSLGDPDDQRAVSIAARQSEWGKALFNAVFAPREAQRLFNRFQDRDDDARLLTISAEHPSILTLPWELLHDSADGGGFLFMENPRISIRRRIAGATGGRGSFRVEAKDRLHLLFVVSRPEGTGFIDPRADALSVLEAIEGNAAGRVTWEFLRPPTLDSLLKRLEDRRQQSVDILHFDGHGAFDRRGGLPQRVEDARGRRGVPAEEMVRVAGTRSVEAKWPPNTGYLLFETGDREPDFVSADKLGANLHRHKVGLVVLSACQSAAVQRDDEGEQASDDRPMGSVAARLTATGIPSVLAMTYTVLVSTTRVLFGEVYENLVQQQGIGEALDNARRYLFNHPKKYEVQRGPERKPLELYDWFIPALYQPGSDGALLNATPLREVAPPAATLTNLPPSPEAGFFGRRRELWDIERWFAADTRRITITGFGGQGKTALAQETGRWLTRAGMFAGAVFVDYSRVQSRDAVAVAVSNIGSTLGHSLIDADAVTAALRKHSTLVILDNLEALAPEPLRVLLDAAEEWSSAGESRVLLTTRTPDFAHAAYRVEGTRIHRRIVLDGLGSRLSPDEALEWFAELMKLPPVPSVPMPRREALVQLFDKVRFHPLSIRVLAQQLKTRRPAELGERLECLMLQDSVTSKGLDDGTPASLLASLELSLDSLDDATRNILPRLGVFQGGAFEDDLLAVTGLGASDDRRRLEQLLSLAQAGDADQLARAMGKASDGEISPAVVAEVRASLPDFMEELRGQLTGMPASVVRPELWPKLRRQLEAAALIEIEMVEGVSVPFLRFHPTLAAMLWAQLDEESRRRWSTAHRRRYYDLSNLLVRADARTPVQARSIAWRELPNLLQAAYAALEAGEPYAVDFASNLDRFVALVFGLKTEAAALSAKATAAAGAPGSRDWYLAQTNRGEQLRISGRTIEAAQVFEQVLEQLGDAVSAERVSTLARVARCLRDSRPDLSAQRSREAIAICAQLEQTEEVASLRSALLTGLADALRIQGEYAEAQQAYEESLATDAKIGDERGMGVVLGQLGTLAMEMGRLPEAAERFRLALTLFQRLGEPAMEQVAWHQLGMVFWRSNELEPAERHFRESARIAEGMGDLKGAAGSWIFVALVTQKAGNLEAAEQWYRKAITAAHSAGDLLATSAGLNNLAVLLRKQPGRLAEARQAAEESLAHRQVLGLRTPDIWRTYQLLSQIAEDELATHADAGAASELRARALDYRQKAREAKRVFAGTRHELLRHRAAILGTVSSVADPSLRQQFDSLLNGLEQRNWIKLVSAIRRILNGERDADALCVDLDLEDSMIVLAILDGLSDPSTLADLVEGEQSGSE